MIKFSIITVCYNASSTIRNTIESVISQDYPELEYLIIDGASTDGTLDIIKEYAAKDSRISYVSEADAGLYDAMNKGARLATGDFIEFLNSGDELAGEDVVSSIARYVENIDDYNSQQRIILYGNIVYMNPDGSEDVRLYGASCGKAIYYSTGDCVNHQACFASRECFADNDGNVVRPFDNDTYRICADRDWMMRNTRAKASWIPLGITVVRYSLDEGSVSVRDKDQLRKEERICMKRHYPMLYPIYLAFDGCRNNKVLARVLHFVYEKLYLRK